jgi:DNA-binding winged helix-turn-helix (wHTH) protein/tetratricopeptide (TPR) repeat protein
MENESRPLQFGPFHLDSSNARLFRGDEVVRLTPKAFDVLSYLAQRPGQLVTKDELLETLWDDTLVTDASLVVCIREIRKALDDDAQAPRYIETVHRRGYRFVARAAVVAAAAPTPREEPPTSAHIGREEEVAELLEYLDRALAGQRQVVFLAGSPGAGKTTLIEAFLSRIQQQEIWVANGQCFEQYGTGEAYLPILEALSQLCRRPQAQPLIDLLTSHAPTWVVQMPWLRQPQERELSPREVLGATSERMLREMAEVLEAFTARIPLVLVLEDLHWSDYSTTDLIAALARRRGPARLLVVGAYRPVEAILSNHPLKNIKRELELHRLCAEIELTPWEISSVEEYLHARFPGRIVVGGLAQQIHERTDGHPLFVVNLIDYLVTQQVLIGEDELRLAGDVPITVPDSIRPMIEKQIELLSDEQQEVLEGASIAGVEFSAATVAAALDADVVETEESCQELARRQHFLVNKGTEEWPDGTVATRYRFLHELYHNVLYERISAARRARGHQRIALRFEQAFSSSASPEAIAALAMHSERGRDFPRAVRYLRRAAEGAARRYANREASDYLSRALALIDRLPEANRTLHRLELLEQRGVVHRAQSDLANTALDFEAMATCAQQAGLIEDEIRARFYLASALSWVDRQRCLAVMEQTVELSQRLDNPLLQAQARGWAGYWNLLWCGWSDEAARASAEAVAAARQAGDRALLGIHVSRHAYFLALRSEYDAACAAAEEGVLLSLESGDAFDYLVSHFFWAWALLHRGQWGALWRLLQDAIQIAERNGHRRWVVLFRLHLAWLHLCAHDAEQALRIARHELEQAQASGFPFGQLMGRVILGFAHLGCGQIDEAFACFEHLGEKATSDRLLMDWIWRMLAHLGRSECWLRRGQGAQARHEAERLGEIAAQPGERTYLALSQRLLAEAALLDGKPEQAQEHLGQAFALLDRGIIPLAAWQIHATASRLEPAHRARQQEVLRNLAQSLGKETPLGRHLLQHLSS